MAGTPDATVAAATGTPDLDVELDGSSGGGAGVTDHGLLSGLADDDHSGIYDTIAEVTAKASAAQAAAEATAATALSGHGTDTTAVHGVADTSVLETASGAQGKVDTHVNLGSAAHAGTAVAFTPAGGIAATDVSGALAELDSEKQTAAQVTTAAAAAVTTHEVDAAGDTKAHLERFAEHGWALDRNVAQTWGSLGDAELAEVLILGSVALYSYQPDGFNPAGAGELFVNCHFDGTDHRHNNAGPALLLNLNPSAASGSRVQLSLSESGAAGAVCAFTAIWKMGGTGETRFTATDASTRPLTARITGQTGDRFFVPSGVGGIGTASGSTVALGGVAGATVPQAAVTAAPVDASTAHALSVVFADTEVEAALNALGTKLNAMGAVVNTLRARLTAIGVNA